MDRRIGVALSGGGYRAAAWGLGTLLYLADARQNSYVVTCSSVSGGSITNGVVALHPYRGMRPEAVWELSARLARRLAGDLNGFLLVLALHAVAWVVAIVAAGGHQLVLAAILLGAAAVLSLLLAQICRDATFGSPLVWLYCDALSASLAVLAFAAGEGWWWLAGLLFVGFILLFRGIVIGWAIGRSVLEFSGRRARLEDLPSDIDHVICACDLHGRHHVYFGRDFVYSYGHGLGTRPSLPLDAAVQSSANLPGAFPPRAMRASPFRFTGPRYRSPLVALTDGGVYDNMAEEWLLSFGKRAAALHDRATEVSKTDPELGAVFKEAAERLADREPNFVVIANASGPLGFRFAWTTFLPLVGELLALFRVKSILYDDGHTTRRRLIVDEFIDGDLTGIIVHIATDPWSVVRDGLDSADRSVQARAVGAAYRLASTPGLDRPISGQPAGTGTTLYPLGRGRIAKLLQHSYALASVQASIWHDLPLLEIPPLAWFEALEAGRVWDRPVPPEAVMAGVKELELAPPGESVPVWVDAVRDVEGTSMARVTYFVVASEVPEPSWLLELGEGHGASATALGLAGVICGPGPRTALFRSPEELGGLFEQIEAAPDLWMDVEDLSVPASWLGTTEPVRGDVFRLDRALFQTAYRFRMGELSLEAFVDRTIAEGAVAFSPEETVAFREWAEGRIAQAIDMYPKDESLKLLYREEA